MLDLAVLGGAKRVGEVIALHLGVVPVDEVHALDEAVELVKLVKSEVHLLEENICGKGTATWVDRWIDG